VYVCVCAYVCVCVCVFFRIFQQELLPITSDLELMEAVSSRKGRYLKLFVHIEKTQTQAPQPVETPDSAVGPVIIMPGGQDMKHDVNHKNSVETKPSVDDNNSNNNNNSVFHKLHTCAPFCDNHFLKQLLSDNNFNLRDSQQALIVVLTSAVERLTAEYKSVVVVPKKYEKSVQAIQAFVPNLSLNVIVWALEQNAGNEKKALLAILDLMERQTKRNKKTHPLPAAERKKIVVAPNPKPNKAPVVVMPGPYLQELPGNVYVLRNACGISEQVAIFSTCNSLRTDYHGKIDQNSGPLPLLYLHWHGYMFHGRKKNVNQIQPKHKSKILIIVFLIELLLCTVYSYVCCVFCVFVSCFFFVIIIIIIHYYAVLFQFGADLMKRMNNLMKHKRGKLKPNALLAQFYPKNGQLHAHTDSQPGWVLSFSCGNSALFFYYHKNKKQEVLLESGDVILFDSSMLHGISRIIPNSAPDAWRSIYTCYSRFNLQFKRRQPCPESVVKGPRTYSMIAVPV